MTVLANQLAMLLDFLLQRYEALACALAMQEGAQQSIHFVVLLAYVMVHGFNLS